MALRVEGSIQCSGMSTEWSKSPGGEEESLLNLVLVPNEILLQVQSLSLSPDQKCRDWD
jgi:hypothetical protein